MSDVLDTLARLGDTPNDIAAALQERGVKGHPYDAGRCPLARFLSDELGQSCYVCGWWVVVGGVNKVSTPAAAVEFIRCFDVGDWPELVEDTNV